MYNLNQGGKYRDRMFEDYSKKTPGNVHMNIENRLKEFSMVEQKPKVDDLELREKYYYSFDNVQSK
jgi:hypothetical protein